MLRLIFSSLTFTLIVFSSFSEVSMRRVRADLFINGGKTDFKQLFHPADNDLKNIIQTLFTTDQLDHPYSKAYDVDAKFESYWSYSKGLWHSIDLNNDGQKELLYLSDSTRTEELEIVEIYSLKQLNFQLVFREEGHLLAYKLHPNTKETLLFLHRYPCCSSFSHNVNMLRLINGNIKMRKKYFIARDSNMKGDFFPKKAKYTSQYHYFTEPTDVRWSPKMIVEGASQLFSQNRVAFFPNGTPYKVLADEKGWQYILISAPPSPLAKGEIGLTPENFDEVHIFGWIRKKKWIERK